MTNEKKVLIVEDDKNAGKLLVDLLRSHGDLKLIGVATTVDEAENMVQKHQPDLVISDVVLPPVTSFDWLVARNDIPFDLIFTTSFEEFAIQAFRLAAIDYLLKPIDPFDFNFALDRFRKKTLNDSYRIQMLFENLRQPKTMSKVALPTMTGFLFVEIRDIVRCQADNTYTTFFMIDKRKIIVSKTLKEVEKMMDGHHFFRVHNSHLINLVFVDEYLKGEGGQVKLNDGSIIDVSRRRKDLFLATLKK